MIAWLAHARSHARSLAGPPVLLAGLLFFLSLVGADARAQTCPAGNLAAGAAKMVARLAVVHNGVTLASGRTHAFTIGTPAKTTTAPRATIESVRVVHNQIRNKQRGMVVHAKVTVHGCLG